MSNTKILVLIEKDYKESKGSYTDVGYTVTHCNQFEFLSKQINQDYIAVLPCDTHIAPSQLENCLKGKIIKVIYSDTHKPQNKGWKDHPKRKVLKSGSVFGQNSVKSVILSDDLEKIKQLLKDPLIIIFTLEGTREEDYPEWSQAKKLKDKGKCYKYESNQIENWNNTDGEEKIRIIEFKTNTYTVLFVKENGPGIKENGSGGIDDLLEKILTHENWKNINEKYVAIHSLKDYLKDKAKFENQVKYICDFHHTDKEPFKSFVELLIEFLNKLEKGNSNLDKTCKEIVNKIIKLSIEPEESMSIFKHKILNILTPIDVDIQGIIDANYNKNYWSKIVGAYKKGKLANYFRDLRKILYDKEQETLESFLKKILIREIKAFTKISNLLPNRENSLTGDEKVNELLLSITQDNINLFKRIINQNGNVFRKWLYQLIDALEELKRELLQ